MLSLFYRAFFRSVLIIFFSLDELAWIITRRTTRISFLRWQLESNRMVSLIFDSLDDQWLGRSANLTENHASNQLVRRLSSDDSDGQQKWESQTLAPRRDSVRVELLDQCADIIQHFSEHRVPCSSRRLFLVDDEQLIPGHEPIAKKKSTSHSSKRSGDEHFSVRWKIRARRSKEKISRWKSTFCIWKGVKPGKSKSRSRPIKSKVLPSAKSLRPNNIAVPASHHGYPCYPS